MSIDPEDSMLLEKFEKHIRILKGLVPSSVHAYIRHVKEFLAWRDGNALTGPVTRQDIENFLEWCYRRGNGNATRISKLTALQNYFRYLAYSGKLPDDPTANLPRPRSSRPFMLTFSHEEILRLFGAVDLASDKGLRDAVFLILGSLAGFRVSEIVNFKIEQVQDDGKEMDLVIPKTKRGAGRVVYLWKMPADYVRALLLTRLNQGAKIGDPLLTGYYKGGRPRGNRPMSTKGLDTLLKTLARRAKIRKPAVKCHMLRGTHANDLQHVRGYTLPAIMERMGWQNLETAARYLVRRERIHRECRSLHEYWIDLGRVWRKEDAAADSNQAA